MPVSSLPDCHIIVRADMAAAQEFPIGTGIASIQSRRCPTQDHDNEDGVLVIACDAERGVLAVADGFGGQPSGAEAAEKALEALQQSVEAAAAAATDLREAVLDGFERANESVRGLSVGAATTLAAVAIDGPRVRPFHVGDSEILVIGRRGKIKLQTLAHGPVSYAVEAGWLERDAALHHQDRHIVSNMVGTNGMRIDIGSSLNLDPLDTLFIATDGVFDNLHLDEIVSLVRKGTLAEAAEALAEACIHRMTEANEHAPSKPDDLTFILFRLDS